MSWILTGCIFIAVLVAGLVFERRRTREKEHELRDCRRKLAIERRKYLQAMESRGIFKRP